MTQRLLVLAVVVMLSGCTNYKDQKKPIPVTNVTEVQTQAVKKVSIVKFFDYNCGHCRDAHFTVKNLQTQFGERVTVELKHFPLSAPTFLVAETAECARRQNKFEAYHNALMEENFRQYEPENLQKVAQAVGLDLEAFNLCAANGAGKSEVQADMDEATAMGVSGTPYFLLNDSIPLPGAVPEKSFARLIQQVLDGEVQ